MSQSLIIPSRILAKVGRRDIGLRSFSIEVGGWTFGIGTTSADFQIGGKYPSLEALKIAAFYGKPAELPIGPSPLSIATPDGGLIKTVKATLLKALEDNAKPLTTIPPDAALILDAMAILQATKKSASMTYS